MGRFSGFLFNFFLWKKCCKNLVVVEKVSTFALAFEKQTKRQRSRRSRRLTEAMLQGGRSKKKNVKNLQVWKISSNFAKHFRPSSGRHSKPEHIEIIAIDEVVQENKGRRPGASRPADEVSVKFDQRLDSRLSAGRKMSSDGCRCPMGLLILVQAMRL